MPKQPQHVGLSSLPWWVQAIALVGVPAVMAVGLVYWLTATVTARLDAIEAASKAHIATEAIGVEQNWQVVGILQRVCLNTAQTPEDRIACAVVARSGR